VIELPVPSLVLLVGPAGSGKSTFAARHFRPTEVVSSDRCRALVSDSERNQAATADAFRLLHEIVGLRLRRRRLTVVDAVNVDAYDRRTLLDLASAHGVPGVAIVFDVGLDVCRRRAAGRAERTVKAAAVTRQWEAMLLGLPGLDREPAVSAVHVLRSPAEVEAAALKRVRPILPAG
jgi:protein phosphatase